MRDHNALWWAIALLVSAVIAIVSHLYGESNDP